MEIFEVIRNIDGNLLYFVNRYGLFIYVVLFTIVFSKTAFIITPFMPGDSVLLASGTLAAVGVLQIEILILLFLSAAIMGDSQNYAIGRYLMLNNRAHTVLYNKIPQATTKRANEFISNHGSYAIIFSRFVLLIRTFIPVLSALSNYPFRKFLLYNSIGACLWVIVWLGTGYLLGNLPFVANNLSLSLFCITIAVMLPAVLGYVKQRIKLSN